MAEDGEVLRQIWHSYIPCAFSLAQQDQKDIQAPDPYYALVSRLSYFPLALDKVVRHFARFAETQETRDLWLECNGMPLKWHLPVGVLWDLLGGEEPPFQLILHFERFPEEQLFRCSSRAAIESVFMSALKEADALKTRSQVMSAMQKKDHLQLWSGLQNDKFEQFWTINRRLIQPLIRARQQSTEQQTPAITTIADLRRLLRLETDERLITHGVEAPQETPLQWLSEHLSYADNFLHMCLLKK